MLWNYWIFCIEGKVETDLLIFYINCYLIILICSILKIYIIQ